MLVPSHCICADLLAVTSAHPQPATLEQPHVPAREPRQAANSPARLSKDAWPAFSRPLPITQPKDACWWGKTPLFHTHLQICPSLQGDAMLLIYCSTHTLQSRTSASIPTPCHYSSKMVSTSYLLSPHRPRPLYLIHLHQLHSLPLFNFCFLELRVHQ